MGRRGDFSHLIYQRCFTYNMVVAHVLSNKAYDVIRLVYR